MKQIDTHDLNLISGWLQAYADGESLRSQGEHQQIMATLEAIKVLPDAQPAIKQGDRVAVDKPPFDPLVDNWVPYEEDFRTGTVTMRATQEVADDFPVVGAAMNIMKGLLALSKMDRPAADLAYREMWTHERGKQSAPLHPFQQASPSRYTDVVFSEETLREVFKEIDEMEKQGRTVVATAHLKQLMAGENERQEKLAANILNDTFNDKQPSTGDGKMLVSGGINWTGSMAHRVGADTWDEPRAEPVGDDAKVLWPGPSSNYWMQTQAEMMRLKQSLFADLYMMQPILEPHPDGTLLLIPAITPAEARKQLYGNSFSSHTIDDIWDEQKPKRKPL